VKHRAANLRANGIRRPKPKNHDMPLTLGVEAPEFTLVSSEGREVALSAFRDRENVVLIFYPKDQTPGCTAQLCRARDDRDAFAAAGAVAFGINGDDAASHKRFIEKFALTMPLLTDPGLAVAKQYDAVMGIGPLKIVKRTVVGIGRNGRVAFYERGMPDTKTILAPFSRLSPRA
jgi:peroxiredoxin Q/BCP